jgi:hypothetical protein
MLRRNSGSYLGLHCTATYQIVDNPQDAESTTITSKESKLKYTVPVELDPPSTRKDHSFELSDHIGLTAQAFEVMAQ